MHIKKKQFFACMMIFIEIFTYCILVSTLKDMNSLCTISSIFIVLSGGIMFFSFGKITGAFVYYLCLLIMHCGQIFMLALKLPFPQSLKSSITLGQNGLNEFAAIKFTVIASMLVVFVFCLLIKEQDNRFGINESKNYTLRNVKLSFLGKVVVAVIILMSIASDFTRAYAVSIVGYLNGYKQTNTILYYADMLLPLFIFLLIIMYRNDLKTIKLVYIFILVKSAFSAFFIGVRSIAVLSIVMYTFAILIMTDNTMIKRLIKKLALSIAIIGVIALPLSGVMRGTKVDGISDFLRNYNPISYSLTEFGGSINNVRLSVSYFADKDFGVGTFFSSFLSILPVSTFLFPSIVGGYGNAYANYINNRVGVYEGAGGAGGSLIGEAVFWFGDGIGGYIYLVIITVCVTICFNKLTKVNKTSSNVANVGYLFLLYELFYQIRGTIYAVQTGVKLSIYFYIIFILFSRYFFKYEDKN